MPNNDFISSIADILRYPLDICPENCKYHTSDDGCKKSYIPCPSYTEEDGYDLGCGGAGFEIEEREGDDKDEDDKK